MGFFFLCAVMLMITCAKKDNNPTGPGGTNNVLTMTYTISGSTITITRPAQTYTDTYCEGDSLVTETQTDTARTYSEQFQLIDNDTKLVISGDTAVRVGTGSGIQGQWNMGGETVQFGAGTITVDLSQTSSTPADDFLEYELPSDLGEVTATKISNNQVKLTGATTGEIVTVTISGSGDETYTSSNSAHAAGTWYMNPNSCPNETPDWFYLFLSENGSGMFKKAMSKSVQQHHKLF